MGFRHSLQPLALVRNDFILIIVEDYPGGFNES
jgi:hypothetical protein